MRSQQAAVRIEASTNPTRAVTKFDFRRPVAAPPESATVEIAKTTARMPFFERRTLIDAAVPTPVEEIRPVRLAEIVERPAAIPTRSREDSGVWQAFVLSLGLCTTFGIVAGLVGALVF